MRRILTTTLAAALLGGAGLSGFAAGQAAAQPSPPPPGAVAEGSPGGPPPWAGRGERGHRHDHDRRGPDFRRGAFGPGGAFSMFPRVEDKALTADEVQKIAEGFLLFMAQRDWRIVELRDVGSTVEFGIAAAQGSPFARFKIDKKTGRPERIS